MGSDIKAEGHEPSEEHEDPAALTPEQEANRDSEAATQGDQGPQVREQDAATAVTSADPNTPVAQSPPPPEAQSGVPTGPALPENQGVEAQEQYRGDTTTQAASGAEAKVEPGSEEELGE
jgi:hypothetical protein